jgi:ribosomal protein S19E (S16A)
VSEAQEMDFIRDTLRFNEMPEAARAWLVQRMAVILRKIAANDNPPTP